MLLRLVLVLEGFFALGGSLRLSSKKGLSKVDSILGSGHAAWDTLDMLPFSGLKYVVPVPASELESSSLSPALDERIRLVVLVPTTVFLRRAIHGIHRNLLLPKPVKGGARSSGPTAPLD